MVSSLLSWTTLWRLFLGQLLSFVLASMSLTSSLLSNLGVDAPITQSSFVYLSLALVYGSILLYRRKQLQVRWYWYILLAFVDVQGNYLVNKAYQFSSITSVTLLDCFTIPWVIILTRVFIGTRYSILQLLSGVLCVVGLGLVLVSDAGVAGGGGGSRPVLGDALVLCGTLCFAISNVSEEFCVKNKDQVEVVAMLGLFGMLVSAAELSVFELKTLETVNWSTNIILAGVGYAIAGFSFYTLVPFVLKSSGSTMMNLSLLTSDMWAVVIRIFLYNQQVNWLYYLAFAVVAVGVITYSTTGVEDAKCTAEYKRLGDVETEQIGGS